MTKKLYDIDSYIKEFDANVTSCNEVDGGFEVILDKTAFFPTEGGQYHDNGSIAGIKVLDVYLKGEDVIHLLPYPVQGFCRCEIDFEERFDKMQQHTGEHIVCGIVHKIYGYDNVGFHLGADDVTFDFNGPLSREQLYEIEVLANKAVTDNLPVTAYYPKNPKELDYRSKLELEDGIRIVDIEGVDKCACCAPHVKTTGEVGYIKLTDGYSYKGGVRIHLACGKRAVEDGIEKHKNLIAIAKVLSSGTNNAAEFFEKYVSDVTALKQSLSDCKKELLDLKAQVIEPKDKLIIFDNSLEPSLLRQFANALCDKYQSICAVFCGKDESYNYCIASKTENLRDFAKDFNQALCGKGGGSPQMIQGSVNATKTEIEQYLNK